MNKNLTEQSKKPSDLMISKQTKYDPKQDLKNDSPLDSPELKKREKGGKRSNKKK